MTWWLIVRVPAGVYAWALWAEGEQPVDELVDAARAALGVPVDDDAWLRDPRYDIQLTLGEPHRNLLEGATLGTVDVLRMVDPEVVAAYRAQRAETKRAALLETARRVLAGLTDEVRAALLAEIGQT